MKKLLFPSLHTPEERGLLVRVTITLALPLALVVLIPVAFGIYLVGREAQHRDVQAADQRLELKRAFTISLVNQCNQIEELKAGFREQARTSFRDLDQNLRLLGLERTPAITRAARAARDVTLRRYKPVSGGTFRDNHGRLRWHGCGNYPAPIE